jgi:hypothetical protein
MTFPQELIDQVVLVGLINPAEGSLQSPALSKKYSWALEVATFGAPGKQQVVSGPGSPNPAIGNSIREPLGTIPVGENL